MDPAGVAVGTPADFAKKGLHIVADKGILVGHDDKGFYALTSVCTHNFCHMDTVSNGKALGEETATGITCKCHGSEFDLVGINTKAPQGVMGPLQPLKPYAMALGCDGKLYVDMTMVVANTVRLMA